MIFKNQKSGQRDRRATSSNTSLSTQQYYKATPKPSIEKKTKNRNWFLPLVIICLLLGFAYNLVITPAADLSLNSEAYRPKSEYQIKLDQELGTLMNRNKLTIDSQKLTESLRKDFPEISSLGINLPLIGKQPQVDIKVVEPTVLLQSQSGKYVIDKQGRAVVKNTTGDVSKLLKANDQTGYEIRLGEQVLATDEVSFLSYLAGQSKAKGLNIKEFVLPSSTPSEVYMYLSDKPYYVKFLLSGSADSQLGTYLALKDKLEAEGIVPGQYIDVRVEEKAFIK